MSKEPQICVNCGEHPATSSTSTVPLCSSCAAQTKKRGVEMAGAKSAPKPDDPT